MSKIMKLRKDCDPFGHRIEAGNYIAYAAAKGRCAGLNIGRVVSFGPAKSGTGFSHCIKVKAVDIGFGEYAPFTITRIVTIRFPERLVVIPGISVPRFIKALLSDDGRCDCSCSTPCPIGKVGSSTRCTAEEIYPSFAEGFVPQIF